MIIAIAFFTVILVLPKQIFSHHQASVLGESTSSSQILFPPITSGAGFILPDSPLFFLDKAFQKIRLLVAFTPERRAKVREQIAGERLAELRIMLARNNSHGIGVALSNLAEESGQMAATLADTAASGRDVKNLAKELNETIKTHRKILKILADQTDGVLRLQLETARESLKLAKLDIEDELPEEELETEIEEGLDDEIEELTEEAALSGGKLENAINVLERLVSEAAARQQARREEALKRAIEVKNEALRKQQERLLEEDEEKQGALLEAREKAIKDARDAIEISKEAVEKLREAQEAISEAKTAAGQESSSGSSDSGRAESLDNEPSDNSGSDDDDDD